jgi:arylsulfatase A-like enzyme
MGVYENSLIIVTADHGEFFGEHMLWGHGFGPYEDVHRVPLIVKFPNCTKGGVVEERVSIMDIFPTTLETLGIEPDKNVHGKTLRAPGGYGITEQYVNSYLANRYGERFARGYRALYRDQWKCVFYSDGEVELYDLSNDPDEKKDLAQREIAIVEAMETELQEIVNSVPPIGVHRGRELQMDDELKRALKALGYAH